MPRRIEDGLTLRKDSDAAISSSNTMYGKMLPLTDRNLFEACPQLGFTESNSRINVDVFRYGGNSPPPPALSPANSSPGHLPPNLHTRASSPSPPVIDAEMTENSSESLRAVCDKDKKIVGADKARLSIFCHQGSKHIPCLSIKPFPRLKSSTSPSSSSTLSASSSTATGSAERLKDSLPILEKISIVLGSPRGSCSQALPLLRPDESSISYIQQGQLETQASVALIPIDIQAKDAATLCNTQEKLLSPGDALPIGVRSPLKTSISTVTTGGRARGRGRNTAGGKRRAKSRRKQPNFSDDEDIGARAKVPHGRAGVSAVLKRVKQKAGLQRVTSTACQLEGGATSSEVATARRYLESPFFCLCQSGGSSTRILTNDTMAPDNELGISQAPNNVDISNNKLIAAHLISPALLSGFSSLGSGTGVPSFSSNSFTFPPNCPLAPTGMANSRSNELGDTLDQCHVDSRNIFTGLTYRPSLPTRPPSSATLDNKIPWCCAFCGEDNHMSVELGSLYGPYWLTASEVAQLPSNLVHTGPDGGGGGGGAERPTEGTGSGTAPPLSLWGCASVTAAGIRSPGGGTVLGGGGRCQGVTRSTNRRLASGQPSSSCSGGSMAKTDGGGLRLVIKAPNPKKPKAMAVSYHSSTAVQECPDTLAATRVGLNGEVWFHLECILWAPGTYLLGNGVICGLGEALQLAMDVACSHCDKPGAVLSCCYRGCNLSYHYRCSFKAGCHLNQDQYSLVCRKHHVYS